MSSNISRSSTTDDEELGNEATSFLNLKSIQRHYESQKTPKSRLRSLLTLLTYVLVGCLSILLYEVSQRTLVYQDRTINLLPSRKVLPVFAHNKLVRFAPNQSYYGEESLPIWWALNARGGGLINIKNGPQLGLGTSLKGIDEDEGYGISVFHQVHCMAAMRQAYQQALSGTVTSSKQTVDHVEHCFDYIRQVLICHADLGLEHESTYAGQIDGWGALHQCRDWDAVVKFAEDNKVRRSVAATGDSHHSHHE